MSRIDWLVLRRLASRVAITIIVIWALAVLVSMLDVGRQRRITAAGGPFAGILVATLEAGRWSITSLPVTVLLGTILGILELQARREMTAIKSAGLSIWRIMRAPLIAIFLFGLIAGLLLDSAAITKLRTLPGTAGSSDTVWLQQEDATGPYVLRAEHVEDNGRLLGDVTIFRAAPEGERIEAQSARLERGSWALENGMRYRPDAVPVPFAALTLQTATTPADMQVRLRSTIDLTLSELFKAYGSAGGDPSLRAGVVTSLLKLIALPFLLVGSVLIAFAFTSGYRRTNKYGVAVLYGVVLGFVVYVITEMASRAGFAGVLEPTLAAAGPAFVAIVIGTTVLLYKEDGRV